MADDPNPTPDATSGPDSGTPAAEAVDYSGRTFGDFQLVRRIGVGGMGQVYLARQTSLKRQVAIKVLKPELAANLTSLKRFQAEAEAVANITHANIVQVYAIGEAAGVHYMALEYVDGRNLRDQMTRKGLPDLPLALHVMRQVLAALDRAGELGFVHRDIKPENILLSRKGEVKVADFGLSRAFAADAPVHLTQSGVTMGTPLYMAPEQVRGQPVDPRTDLYSFGVTCYHMLKGEPPFSGVAPFDVAIQHVQAEPPPLADARPDLPPELCAIVHKLMAKRPDDRYQSAREVLRDLARLREALASGQTVALPAGAGVSAVSGSGATPAATQPMPRPLVWQKFWWAAVALGAAGLAAGGAYVHRATAPAAPPVDPAEAALADVDPPPAAAREKELLGLLRARSTRSELAPAYLLDLAHLYLRERRPDDALKLFDRSALEKFPALDGPLPGFDARVRVPLLSLLGRGVVLAHLDQPEKSNDAFRQALREFGARPLVKPKKDPPVARGPVDAFFAVPRAGLEWRRAVGDAVERNAKNAGGKVPDDLTRLRGAPAGRP